MKFPFAFLFIYLSTNYMDKSQIPSRSRHPSVARTSSFSSSFFPPLLINHTSIRLVNPGIHAPHAPFRVDHLYRGTRNNRRSLSWIDRGICPLSP